MIAFMVINENVVNKAAMTAIKIFRFIILIFQ